MGSNNPTFNLNFKGGKLHAGKAGKGHHEKNMASPKGNEYYMSNSTRAAGGGPSEKVTINSNGHKEGHHPKQKR